MTEKEMYRNRLKAYFRMLATHNAYLGNELVDVLDGYLDAKFKREWQPLTDEDRNACLVEADPCEALLDHEAWELMRTIEAKLREKNGL